MPEPRIITQEKNIRKLAKRWQDERCGGLFRDPIRFLRWTGLVKYRPISYTQFNPLSIALPAPFNAPVPRTAGPRKWTASKVSGDSMNHTVTIERGLATCYGYIFDRRGRLVEGATHKHREGRHYPEWITRSTHIQPHGLFPRIRRFSGRVAVLTASTQHMYFHWLLDVLPRFAMVEAQVETGCPVFLDARQRFQKETLVLLGIKPEQMINVADVPILTASDLLVPCHQIMKGREYPFWALDFLRARLLPQRQRNPFKGATKLYISRQAAPTRKPTNEDEIVTRLEACGFKAVAPEKLSLPEQISLFRDARVIVAPHGAGLANLVFCTSGATVIELFPAANVDLYYRLCVALGLNYCFVKGEEGDPDCLTSASYHIAWETIERTLKMAGVV